jgi:DNA-binding transcriptional LysR family regulator
MNAMQLRNFDLNLLVVFDAIFRERTIAAASARLNLSQSAISHALGRLRRSLGDELFVRDADGMRPTPKAMELARPVQKALGGIQTALLGGEFEPQRSTRNFVIAASDYSCSILIPRLVERLASVAPAVDLTVLPVNRDDVIEQLDAGLVDLAIGWLAAVPERFGRCRVLTEELVLVVRKDHPLTGTDLTPEHVLRYGHVVVNYLGSDEGLVDGFRSERGVLRRIHMESAALEAPQRHGRDARIAVRLPQFWCVPDMLLHTDLIASIPRRLAQRFTELFALVSMPSPFEASPVTVEAIWHQPREAEPGGAWLRGQIGCAAGTLPP